MASKKGKFPKLPKDEDVPVMTKQQMEDIKHLEKVLYLDFNLKLK